jgi:hypothetical protein
MITVQYIQRSLHAAKAILPDNTKRKLIDGFIHIFQIETLFAIFKECHSQRSIDYGQQQEGNREGFHSL